MKLLLYAFIWLVAASIIPEITTVVTFLWVSIVFIVGITNIAVKILDFLF